MPSAPQLSVLMPAYNASGTIAAAIQSVLSQEPANLELVVVDDGSRDRTAEIVRSFSDSRIRLLELQTNAGVVGALNFGLGRCRGQFIARQDADDVSLAGRFHAQLQMLARAPALAVVGCALQTVLGSGETGHIWRYPTDCSHASWQSLFKTPVAHSAAIIRRCALEKAGGYRVEFECAEDYDLWSRLLDDWGVASSPKVYLRYRLSQSGVSHANRAKQERAHVRVASANMSRLLGRPVASELVHTVALGIDSQTSQLSFSTFDDATQLCTELLGRFRPLVKQGASVRAVESDYAGRMRDLWRMLPVGARLDGLRLVRQKLKDVAVPFRAALFGARP